MGAESGSKSRLAIKLTGTAGAIITVLIVIGVLEYRSVQALMQATRWVGHTDVVTSVLNSTQSNLHTASIGVQALILNSQEAPGREESASANLTRDLETLRELTSDNPRQQARLAHIDSLLSSQRKLETELMAMRRRGKAKAESLFQSLSEHDQIEGAIDAEIGEMLNEEAQLLRGRTQAERLSENRTLASIGVGSVAAFIVLLMGIIVMRKDLQAGMAAEAEVLRLNRELEQRVAERTRELADQANLVEVAHDAIIVRAMDGTIQFWNKGAESIYGFSREQAIGKLSHTLLQTELPNPIQQIEDILTRTSTWEGELNHIRRDGSPIVVASRWVLQQTTDGQRVLEINTDITARKQAQRASQRIEERFRLVVEGVKDYGIFVLDPLGHVITWNTGAQRIKGYFADEIIGQHFSRFYPPAEIESGKPAYELKVAAAEGRFEDEGWRVRKDGTRFWANVIITALRDPYGTLLGFSKITRDLTERKMAEDRIAALNAEILERNETLLAANKELETFSYSVSHDLRAPLRSIHGFSAALLEDYSDQLDAVGKSYLQKVSSAATRMGHLIDDMIELARTARAEMSRQTINLSSQAMEVASQLQALEPERKVRFRIQPGMNVEGDRVLLRSVVENLMNNAWKFTARKADALIEMGALNQGQNLIYFVRDNGAGFDMRFVDKLFGVFQRLHSESEYPGTGVGLATVQRIIQRHGGKIWAEGKPGEGATFYFELATARTHTGPSEAVVKAESAIPIRKRGGL